MQELLSVLKLVGMEPYDAYRNYYTDQHCALFTRGH